MQFEPTGILRGARVAAEAVWQLACKVASGDVVEIFAALAV
jgi:hypothetical protein